MSVLKYFKNTSGRPPKGRQALSVIFFFKFATKSLAKKNARGPVAPPSGDRWAPPTGATGGLSPPPLAGDRGGAVAPPRATGSCPLYNHSPPFPPQLSPKIPPKIQKKREG